MSVRLTVRKHLNEQPHACGSGHEHDESHNAVGSDGQSEEQNRCPNRRSGCHSREVGTAAQPDADRGHRDEEADWLEREPCDEDAGNRNGQGQRAADCRRCQIRRPGPQGLRLLLDRSFSDFAPPGNVSH